MMFRVRGLWKLFGSNKPGTATFFTSSPQLYVERRNQQNIERTFAFCRRCNVCMDISFGSCTVCSRPLLPL